MSLVIACSAPVVRSQCLRGSRGGRADALCRAVAALSTVVCDRRCDHGVVRDAHNLSRTVRAVTDPIPARSAVRLRPGAHWRHDSLVVVPGVRALVCGFHGAGTVATAPSGVSDSGRFLRGVADERTRVVALAVAAGRRGCVRCVRRARELAGLGRACCDRIGLGRPRRGARGGEPDRSRRSRVRSQPSSGRGGVTRSLRSGHRSIRGSGGRGCSPDRARNGRGRSCGAGTFSMSMTGFAGTVWMFGVGRTRVRRRRYSCKSMAARGWSGARNSRAGR